MELITEPITGTEHPDALPSPLLRAVAQFYQAFNQRDMTLMRRVWLTTDEVSMDNPIGGIRRGWAAIEAGYARIFGGAAQVYVEFFDYTLHATDQMFLVTGRERGHFTTAGHRLDLDIRTSRLFINSAGKWRQLHHHGSIDDPQRLAAYQQAVRPA